MKSAVLVLVGAIVVITAGLDASQDPAVQPNATLWASARRTSIPTFPLGHISSRTRITPS